MTSNSDRARILQIALDDRDVVEMKAAFNWDESSLPFEIEFKCPAEDYGSFTVDHHIGRLALVILKHIIEAELHGLLRASQITAPPAEELSIHQPSPIARLRALSASGKLDRWIVSGESASEISAALRLIPQVLEQLDRGLAELRKVG